MRSTFERRKAFNLSPKNSEPVFEEIPDETLSLFILTRYALIIVIYTNIHSRTYIISVNNNEKSVSFFEVY